MGTTGQSITLANSIIGVGILAMPFCFQQCGVLLATLILLSMGLVSRLCCYFLLKSALIARRRNFEFLAFHVFGSVGKLGVEVGIIGFLMGTCIAYFVVVGDLGPQIVAKMFNINQSDILRTSIMVIVSLVCVLPLGLLRNVDSLSNVSAATICFYFCLVMKVIVEAASQLLTGDWQAKVETWRPAGVLQCVPIFSMALFCQTQLFELFESLPSLSLEKMNLVTKNAINICTAVYFTLGLFGYIAFSGQDISGNILMSLSPTMANDVIKLGFVMSVAFSFPLIIFPCRASLYSLLYKKVHSSHHDHIINHSIPERSFRLITVGIVAGALFVSLLLPNIELVLGLVGSTIGVLVCVVFPAACFIHVTFKDTNERVLAKVILVLGLIIMVLGTYANLQAAENQIDKYDDKYITKERIDKMVEDFFQKMEKNEGVMAKPEINNDKNEQQDKVDNDVIKESVALPPNPVPPESQSGEKEKSNGAEIKPAPIVKEVIPETVKEIIDKVSETHPKNLNKLNDAKIANGQNIDKIVDKLGEEIKPQSNEEKLNLMKQQQLIETIKQHGEEQKELIKEQKEILTEIKKTKEELQKSKQETAEADAKKIAVESIKKIANVAIQSLASVSDKPGQMVDESEKLEKLADKAVQEIELKAAETIEAIKEIKEKPESAPQVDVAAPQPLQQNELNQAQNVQTNQNEQPNVAQVQNNVNNVNPQGLQNNVNRQPIGNLQAGNVVPPQGNVQPNIAKPAPPSLNVAQPVQNAAQSGQHVAKPAQNVAQSSVNAAQPVQNGAQSGINVAQPVQNVVQTGQNVAQNGLNVGQPVQNVAQTGQNVAQPVSNIAQNIQPAQNANSAPNIIPPDQNLNSAPNVIQSVQNPAQPSNIVFQPANVPQPAQNAQGANAVPPNQNTNAQNAPANNAVVDPPKNPVNIIQPNVVQKDEKPKQNQHSHSPDEPQSYKQGEETQDNVDKTFNLAQNVPLPLAVQSQNAQPNPDSNKVPNTVQNNGVQSPQVQNAPRQKREVVDCTEKSILKPEDKEICNTLIDNPGMNMEVKDILSTKVDLSDVVLPKDIAMQGNVLHHISRSLKIYEDKER